MLTSLFLCRLKAHFGLDPDSDSSSTDLAMGHAATGINWTTLEEKILQPFCTVSHGRFGGEPPGPGGLPLQIRPAHGELPEVGHLHAAAGQPGQGAAAGRVLQRSPGHGQLGQVPALRNKIQVGFKIKLSIKQSQYYFHGYFLTS